jgi:hypothetical protein
MVISIANDANSVGHMVAVNNFGTLFRDRPVLGQYSTAGGFFYEFEIQ